MPANSRWDLIRRLRVKRFTPAVRHIHVKKPRIFSYNCKSISLQGTLPQPFGLLRLQVGRTKIRLLEFLAVLVTWVAVCAASPAQHVRWIALFRTTCSFCCVIPRGDATVLCWWPWWIYAHTAELFPQYIGRSRQQMLATSQVTIICRLVLYVV